MCTHAVLYTITKCILPSYSMVLHVLLAFQPHQFDWLVHLVALVLEWLYQYFEILQSLHSGEEEGHGGGGGGTVTFSISDLVETEESMCE